MGEAKRLGFYANGEHIVSKTEKYMDAYNPSTGEVIAKVPCCTEEEVEYAIACAKQAYPGWSSTPVIKRVQILYKLRDLLVEHMDELTYLVAYENGKAWEEAKGDVLKAKEATEQAISAPSLMMGESLMDASAGYDTVLYREPLGVFAGIVPFNFPAMIPMGWMTPMCIACGNTIVLKAATFTPQSCMRIAELYKEAGLPDGVINIVTCSRTEAEIFLNHPDVKGITFVGSTSVGKHIYATAAASGKRVQALVEAIVEQAKKITVGPAYEKTTAMGPVVNAGHKKSVLAWIEKGLEEGARLVLDGRDVKVPGYENGFYIGPTIFDHVKPGMTVGDSEIFGPVLCIKRVKTFEEGLEVMNHNPFANGSVIFTQNGHYAREFARHTDGGMVGVNVGIPVPVGVFPFSGHKNSFIGDLHCLGKDGYRFYTETKVVTTRWFDEEERKKKTVSTWDGTI